MQTLLRLVPPIRRTRGARLYSADGRRYLDLWLDDGREILGDAGRKTGSYARNAIDKGLLRAYPGMYENRLAKAVFRQWPGFTALGLFRNDDRALAAAARLLGWPAGTPIALADSAAAGDARPAGSAPSEPPPRLPLPLLRPFAAIPPRCGLALIRLPCPGPLGPACLVADRPDRLQTESGDIIASLLCLAATRSLDCLHNAQRTGSYGPAHWERFDRRMAAHFSRNGPYLWPRLPPGLPYDAFFKAALAGGALVSPDPASPSLVPPDFDDGELKNLAVALANLAVPPG